MVVANKLFKLISLVHDTSDIFTLRFEPTHGSMFDFLAGQFVNVTKIDESAKKPEMRPYSISSHPSDKKGFEITVKRKGSFTFFLEALKTGDQVKVTGPLGVHFAISGKTIGDVVMIGGGIGITPFKPISQEALRLGKKAYLFYSTKKREDLVFTKEFQKLSLENKNFVFSHTLTQPPDNWVGKKGRFTLEEIKSIAGGLENKSFFICGPKAMADGFSQQLLEEGVPKECIKAEGWG